MNNVGGWSRNMSSVVGPFRFGEGSPAVGRSTKCMRQGLDGFALVKTGRPASLVFSLILNATCDLTVVDVEHTDVMVRLFVCARLEKMSSERQKKARDELLAQGTYILRPGKLTCGVQAKETGKLWREAQGGRRHEEPPAWFSHSAILNVTVHLSTQAAWWLRARRHKV